MLGLVKMHDPWYPLRSPEHYLGYVTEGRNPAEVGQWIGGGLEALGLEEGQVLDRETYLALYRDEEDPSNGDPLQPGRPGKHGGKVEYTTVDRNGNTITKERAAKIPAFDLTFSSPKGVSLLWGLCDEPVQAAMEEAHHEAIAAAMGYLEREGCMLRRRAGGQVVVKGEGFVATKFDHHTSRDGDPQLHTHVVLLNKARGPDGKWTSLDGRQLFALHRTAGALYQAKLREEVSRRIGARWTARDHKGLSDIAGVPRDLVEAMSKRSQQRDEYIEKKGLDKDDVRHRQDAVLKTRKGKEGGTAHELRDEWRDEVIDLGFDPDQLIHDVRAVAREQQLDEETVTWRAALATDLSAVPVASTLAEAARSQELKRELKEAVEHVKNNARDAETVRDLTVGTRLEVIGSSLFGRGWYTNHHNVYKVAEYAELSDDDVLLEQLTLHQATFARHDIIRLLAERGDVPVSELEAEADRILSLEQTVRLSLDEFRDVGPEEEGRATPVQHQARYTTTKMRRLEQRVMSLAGERKRDRGVVDEEKLEGVLSTLTNDRGEQIELSEDQDEAVRVMTRGGHAMVVIEGEAGTGKTTLMRAANLAWQAAGKKVVGVSTAARAAQQLERDSGIESSTIARLLYEIEGDKKSGRKPKKLPRGVVLVVDEAGMGSTRDLAALADHVASRNGKMVMVGDRKQLAAVEAGGTFALAADKLRAEGAYATLTTNFRQRKDWEKNLLRHLRSLTDVPAGPEREAAALKIFGTYLKADRVTIGDGVPATLAAMTDDYFDITLNQTTDRDEPKTALMMTRRRDHAALLNEAALERARAEGVVRGETFELAGREWQEGMRTITLENDERHLGVFNGYTGDVVGPGEDRATAHIVTIRTKGGETKDLTFRPGDDRQPDVKDLYEVTLQGSRGGTYTRRVTRRPVAKTTDDGRKVIASGRDAGKELVSVREMRGYAYGRGYVEVVDERDVMEPTLRVQLDEFSGGRVVDLPESYVEKHVDLAWAQTITKSQGATVDEALQLTVGLDNHSVYVGASRGRGDVDDVASGNRLYVPALEDPKLKWEEREQKAIDDAVRQLARDGEQLSATAYADARRDSDVTALQDERVRLVGVLSLEPQSAADVREKVATNLADARARLDRAEKAGDRFAVAANREQVEKLEGRLDELTPKPEIGYVPEEDQKRDEWRKQHLEDYGRWQRVNERLDAHARLQAEAARTTRPEYLPPEPDRMDLVEQHRWKQQVLEVETYRARWGVNDPERAFGDPPDGKDEVAQRQKREYEQAVRRAGLSRDQSRGPQRDVAA